MEYITGGWKIAEQYNVHTGEKESVFVQEVTKTGVSSTESDIVLRECHFCGGEAKILNDSDWWMAWHDCPDCGYEGRCTRCLCATA